MYLKILTNNFLFRSNDLIYEKGLSSNYTLLQKPNSYADNSTSISNKKNIIYSRHSK